MKRFFIHADAEAEFKAAVGYYESKLLGLGLDFVKEVENAYGVVRHDPRRFPFHKRTKLQRCPTHRFPYVIYFRDFTDHISIVAVAHVKRRAEYWRQRD